MKLKIHRTVFATLAVLALSVSAAPVWAGKLADIKQNGLRVCLEPGYQPFIMQDKSGKIIGFDPDLADAMSKALDAPKLELVNVPWKDIIPALTADKCDIIMSGMSITDERRKLVDFSSAYIVIGQTVLLRKELATQIKSHTDLNDPKYKVASKQGTTSEAAAKEHIPKAQHLPMATAEEGVAALLAGKADAFVYDSPSNSVAASQHEDKLAFIDSPFTFEPIGWAIVKGDPEFLSWLNDYINKINQDGSKFKLYRKWFKSADWLKELPES